MSRNKGEIMLSDNKDTKYTPAPLEVNKDDWGNHFVEVADHRFITVEGRTAQEAEANARLIACAPEMLEALQWLVARLELEHNEGNMICSAILPKIRQILARATGEDGDK
jgi:hypothetical protein